jgi:AcrR family transcriptional regulator
MTPRTPRYTRGVDERAALRQESRRRELLDAALDIFARQGYRATSMQDIAKKLKVGKASLYHYVDSKEAVLIQLYEEVLRQNVSTARAVVESKDSPLDALTEILVERVVYTCSNQRLLRIFFEEEAELPPRQRARLIAVRHEYEDTILSLVERAKDSGEIVVDYHPRIFVNTLLGAANWVYKWYDPRGELSPDALGREMVSLLLSGVVTNRRATAVES